MPETTGFFPGKASCEVFFRGIFFRHLHADKGKVVFFPENEYPAGRLILGSYFVVFFRKTDPFFLENKYISAGVRQKYVPEIEIKVLSG